MPPRSLTTPPRRVTYGVVTAARNEAPNLERLARALVHQTIAPSAWVIVDNGSTDGTLELARGLSEEHAWITVPEMRCAGVPTRGRTVARAVHLGLSHVPLRTDVVVKVDADVSMEPHFFERMLAFFDADSRLGMASGSRYEREGGVWRQRFLTGTSVEAQCRAYRWECLLDILPFEEHKGWDGIDEVKANLRGWTTSVFRGLAFRHHRRIGGRELSRFSAWKAEGTGAHYMGYRPSYLLLRALFHARREPAAIGLVAGYLDAAIQRTPQCPDRAVTRYVRDQQRVGQLLARIAEVTGAAVPVSASPAPGRR